MRWAGARVDLFSKLLGNRLLESRQAPLQTSRRRAGTHHQIARQGHLRSHTRGNRYRP